MIARGNKPPLRRFALSELDLIGAINGTDKSSSVSRGWDYLRHYEALVSKWRHEPINLLEIGVADGASLSTWKTYFTRATIIGVDIHADCKRFEDDKVVVRVGSQENPQFLQDIVSEYRPTVVIDDGSHLAHHMVAAFEVLFPALLPGGVYIFEDLSFHFEEGVGQWKGAATHQGLLHVPFFDYFARFVQARAANIRIPKEAWGVGRYAFENIDEVIVFGGAAALVKRRMIDIDFAEAVFQSERTKRKEKNNVDFRYAEYLFKHDVNLPRAAEVLRRAVDAGYSSDASAELLTRIYLRIGRLEDATKFMLLLGETRKENPRYWDQLADLHRRRQAFAQEADALRALIALDASRANSFRRLSVALEAVGDFGGALLAAERAFQLESTPVMKLRVETLKQRNPSSRLRPESES